jgi:LIVCS family branched-chain amino acid:cation transporter
MVYPATILLVVMTLFSDKIKNDNAFKGATYVTIIISILTVMNVPLMNNLPLASLGFNWIVPAIIGGVIGNFIKTNKNIDIQAESNFNNASLE